MSNARWIWMGAALACGLCVATAAAQQQDTGKPAGPSGKPEKAQKAKEPAPVDAKLPDYEKELPERRPQGGQWSEIFFVNGSDEAVTIGLRAGVYGKNVSMSARGAAHVKVPNGGYSVFYLIPKEPKKELALREATDSIHSPDGVAQLLKVDRAARGSKEPPGGTPTDEANTKKKVLTLFRGKGITLKADNYVITLSPGRGDALAEIKPAEETKKDEARK